MLPRNEILPVLLNDRVRNINLINFLAQYPVTTIDRVGSSIMVRGTSDHTWVYISSTDEDEFASLVALLTPEDKYFAIIEDWMMPHLLKDFSCEWKLSCMRLYFPDEVTIPEVNSVIRELTPASAEYIFSNSKYKDFTSVEYIVERIKQGTALGIYEVDKLVAWLITHDDGAMGFLHVLPECRGMGYAKDITFETIKRLRAKGELPFVHIEEDNAQSMGLALKTGFQSDRRIHWFKRI